MLPDSFETPRLILRPIGDFPSLEDDHAKFAAGEADILARGETALAPIEDAA